VVLSDLDRRILDALTEGAKLDYALTEDLKVERARIRESFQRLSKAGLISWAHVRGATRAKGAPLLYMITLEGKAALEERQGEEGPPFMGDSLAPP
jgi:predicted transcriptional regulator